MPINQSVQVPVPSDEPLNIYFPSSTRSKLIHTDPRMSQKAYDFDVCGKMNKSYGCSGHGAAPIVVKRIPQTCKQRFSLCCEPRVHHQRMQKHEPIIELMMGMEPDHWDGEFPNSFTFVNIHKSFALPDGKLDGAGAIALAQSVNDTLKKLAREGKYKEDAQCENYFVKVALKGFNGSDAVIQGIYWGPHYAPGAIRSALISRLRPHANIEVVTEPNRRAEARFDELFHIIVPKDETAQAELEILFHGKDLVFYSHNLDWEAMSEHGSFPCDELQGNEKENLIVNSDDYSSEIIPTCLRCGKQADMMSENHPRGATDEEISCGKWERILPRKRKSWGTPS